jgi:hypothetical protein
MAKNSMDFCDGYWTRPYADKLPKSCNYGLEPCLYGFKTWEELCTDCIAQRKAAIKEEEGDG